MGRKYGGAMPKKRIIVKTTTKYQTKLNNEIRKFNWELKNRECRRKEKKVNRCEFVNPVIAQEISNWKMQFIYKITSTDE